MDPRALYLHIPFCKSKCAYCDFDSRALSGCALEDAMDAYVAALFEQVARYGRLGELSQVETVYIGGGTPSLLGDRLIDLVKLVGAYCRPVELTCEANPESFTPTLAEGLHSVGVTRISLGAQSLHAEELRQISRIHTAQQALDAARLSRGFGFSTSLDLMCGLPGQTLQSWTDTLERALHARPDHVSVYPLQLEEGTPLARMEDACEVEIPDEDFQAQCMDIAAALLEERGFARYEVASYARPGHRCRHNIAYWTGVPYLGIGRSAASMCTLTGDVVDGLGEFGEDPAVFADSRNDSPMSFVSKALTCANPAERSLLLSSSRIRVKQLDDSGEQFELEGLSRREAMAEDLMLACRMTDGISPALLDRARSVIGAAELESACKRAVERGLAVEFEGGLVPTHAGWLEGNELFGIFWDLAEE